MHGCAATCVRPSLAFWPPRVAVVHVTREVACVNTMIVWIGDCLTRVHAQADQAWRRPGQPCPHPRRPRACRPGRPPPCLGQRLAHQVQHGPCAVWPAQARRRLALAVSRAPPGPPPRGKPCFRLRPSVRAYFSVAQLVKLTEGCERGEERRKKEEK